MGMAGVGLLVRTSYRHRESVAGWLWSRLRARRLMVVVSVLFFVFAWVVLWGLAYSSLLVEL
jgi:hypothetical protein